MITFGRFGKVLAIEEEKEMFLYKLNELFCGLGDKYFITSYKEKEILKPLKELLKTEIFEESVSIKIEWLSYFLESMYLSYYTLDSKEQKEILDMDYTYDNWKIKSLELMKSFIERTKKILPQIVHFCLDDFYFILHMRKYYGKNFKYDNFVIYIRDYFILEKTNLTILEYRDKEKFNDIQKKVYEIYPIIKEKYGGMNRTLEKILSFFSSDTDYNYDKTKNILDKYYNEKQNNKKEYDEEKIKLKNKYD